jgi:NAD(P)-dependent dehydrogenase (short-subunit alcohol dehydrogenase family)
MRGSLQGRVAFVTGAAQGVGMTIARTLASLGATVAVNDVRESSELSALAAKLGGVTAVADVSDLAQMHEAVRLVEERFGRVDILVCNAAVEQMGDVLTQSRADFFRQIDVNLTGSYWGIEAVLPGMRKRGYGRIIVISSIWGITGWARAAGYSASKAGMISAVKLLARREAQFDIAINLIAPGVIDSPQIAEDARDAGLTLDEMRAHYASRTALRRVSAPEEISGSVAFLAGPTATSFVGQVLQPNGGAQFGWA